MEKLNEKTKLFDVLKGKKSIYQKKKIVKENLFDVKIDKDHFKCLLSKN